MDLDDRKITILKAIIKSYMETGEPVGSRTISKLPNLTLSSATIRNEMSDLEDLGYIIQPHTSAGRIPSDKGYRFYVDEILKEKEVEVSNFKSLMIQRVDKLEIVLKQLAKIIAIDTNYTTMISGPSYQRNKIKFIQLSRMETHKLLIATVFEGNIIKNKIIDIEEEICDHEILNLNLILNTNLNGLAIKEINISIINKLKSLAGEYKHVIELVLDQIDEAFSSDDEDLQIYTSGTTNIFRYPELSDGDKASKLINTFEEKEQLKEILAAVNTANDECSGSIQVYIGDESPIHIMQDCSVVTANYEFGEGIKGTIGIVGPKRMDYEKVLNTLKIVMKELDEKFKPVT